MLLNYLSLIGTVFVLTTYGLMVKRPGPRREHYFNIANACAAPFTIALEILVGAWAVVPLPLAFGIIGLIGWVKEARNV